MNTHNDGRYRRFTLARLALSVILVTVATFGLTTPSQACGIITHTEIAKRAINKLDGNAYPDLEALLTDYQGIVNYGAMFPDWGMAVNILKQGLSEGDQTNYVNLSEDAHDTLAVHFRDRPAEFRSALAGYLLPTFRKSTQSEDDKKAIAFLFGLIAHQEADGPWHINANYQRGYGKQLGESLDPLIEAYVDEHIYDSSNVVDWSFLPKAALIAAYGPKMTGDTLSLGQKNQAAQYWTEAGIEGSSSWIALISPINNIAGGIDTILQAAGILSKLETYQPGGLVDGAEHTELAWRQAWDWLSTYTPITEMSLSSLPPNGIPVEEFSYTQPVSVTLTGKAMVNGQINPNPNNIALIDTGPYRVMYSINGNPYSESEPGEPLELNFDSDGIYKISFYSVDKWGNRDSVENVTINVNMAPPPQPPSPQTPPTPEPCVTYHVVKSGEKTGAIAHTYHLKWKEIYKANDLGMEEKPKVGDRLCIPKSNTARRGVPTNPAIQ